jgi:hypothetical protein
VSCCTRLVWLSSALPSSLRTLRCLGCINLVGADGDLPAQLQQLSLGGTSIKRLPELEQPKHLTRMELEQVNCCSDLPGGDSELPASLKHLIVR